jgi:hypothetical protein
MLRAKPLLLVQASLLNIARMSRELRDVLLVSLQTTQRREKANDYNVHR